MQFHLPKPLHGWRAFVGEVGIVVLGVLIALGAGQVVEDLHWRGEARDFRAAVDSEVDYNLAAYDCRLGQSRCVERRLAELEEWSAEQRAGKASSLLREISYPLRLMPISAIWNSRSADLSAHIPAEARLTYSDLYSAMANLWELEEAERETWLNLNGFNHATKLSPDELIRLDALIFRAKTLDQLVRREARWLGPDSTTLSVYANFGKRSSRAPPFDPTFCEPIVAGAGASGS